MISSQPTALHTTPPAVLHTSHPPNEVEMVDVTTPNKPSSTTVLQTAAGTGTPPETEPRIVHCFCVVHKADGEGRHEQCRDPLPCYYCMIGHRKVLDPSAVDINESKETPPAVLHTSHPPNEIEVVEVTPPIEPSSTPAPHAAPDSTVTPPEKELRKFHCFCKEHEAHDIRDWRHSECRDFISGYCLYCERGHRKVIYMVPEE